jgi:FkbM family methyltransferase
MTLVQTENKGFGSYVVILEDLIGRSIKDKGFWEITFYHIYSKFIKHTDVILDAGANIGFHTVNMARYGNKVYAFEPQFLLCEILKLNTSLHKVEHKVECLNLGLGDKYCEMKMESLDKFKEPDGVDNFGARGLVEGTDGEVVTVVPFDSLDLDVDVIKMDIQGFEIHAINGMVKTIKRNKPWMMLENYVEMVNDELVVSLLKSMGYEIYRPRLDQNLPCEDCIVIHSDNKNHEKIKECLTGELNFLYNLI